MLLFSHQPSVVKTEIEEQTLEHIGGGRLLVVPKCWEKTVVCPVQYHVLATKHPKPAASHARCKIFAMESLIQKNSEQLVVSTVSDDYYGNNFL